MTKFLKYWLPVILWAGLMFFLSAQPDLKSSLPSFYDLILRKIAHITEYAILFLLLARLFKSEGMANKKALVLALAISVLYAFSDEFHQLFVHGRSGNIIDVGIDTVGILIATFLPRMKFFRKYIN